MGHPDLAGAPAGAVAEGTRRDPGSRADHRRPSDRPAGGPRHGGAPAGPERPSHLAPACLPARLFGAARDRPPARADARPGHLWPRPDDDRYDDGSPDHDEDDPDPRSPSAAPFPGGRSGSTGGRLMSQATTAGSAPRVAEAPVRSRRINRALLRPLLMLGGILVVAVASGAYWLSGGRYVSIDDAYVRAAKETIATDIPGTVLSVPVHEGQRVKKGDVMLQIDPRQYQIAVDGAAANLRHVSSTLNAMKVEYQRMLREVE